MQELPMNPPSQHHLGIVHSSFGRLRIHLPDPAGELAARLRGLAGVSYAQANNWTDNILILFNPRQTSTETLCCELQALCPETLRTLPAPPAAVEESVALPP